MNRDTDVELKSIIDQLVHPPEHFNIFLDDGLLYSSDKSDNFEIWFKVDFYDIAQKFKRKQNSIIFHRKSIDSLQLVDDTFLSPFFHKTF